MSPHLPMLKSTEVLAMLRRRGFVAVRQSGSHVIMEHADGRRTVVPLHRARDVPRGLLARILKDTQLTIEELTGS
jgi:predicted RNA binding protein YcfA (HicA-like mRNA interferase family)